MAFTEVTSQSWGGRLMQSIKSVLVGLVMFVVAFPLLFWNEGRAVQTAKSLEEGAASVVSVPSDKVDAAKEGKLVHTTGETRTEETLKDAEFGVAVNAIKLIRTVEMYQWKETKKSEEKKKLGGGTETVTTYDYKQVWDEDLIDSSGFKQPSTHANPGSMPYESTTQVAQKVTLGAFTLSPEQVRKISNPQGLSVDAPMVEGSPLKATAKANAGKFYLGKDPASPQVGDVRVSFEVVKPGPLSLVAVQTGQSFAPWQAPAGDAILLVESGLQTSAQMFQAAQDANAMLTWILRVVGFFLMFIGLVMVFKPISVFGDVVPFVGSMLGAGLGLFAFFVSAGLSTFVIAFAWLFYRPLLGILLLIVGGAAIAGLVMLARKKKQGAVAGAPA